MPTIFTRIIDGEIPGRIIWRDDTCVVMVDVRPLNRGHVLVVPLLEVDRWTDLPADVAVHCLTVAHSVGRAQQDAFAPERVGLMVAGFEIPHAHIHVVPIDVMTDLDFAQADADVDAADLDLVADQLRAALREHGHGEVT